MDVLFAGASALEIIRRVRINPSLELCPVEENCLESCAGPRGSASALNYCALGLSAQPTISHPATIRVHDASHRKRLGIVRCLVVPKELPRRSFLQLVANLQDSELASLNSLPTSRGAGSLSTSRGASNQPPSRGASSQPLSRGASRQFPSRGANGQPPSRGAISQPPSLGARSSLPACEAGQTFDGSHVFVDCVPLACATVAATYQRLIREGKLNKVEALTRLIELVMEFCGCYARDPANPRSGPVTEKLPPFCTIADFQVFLAESKYVKGAALLREALLYARGGSRSAMETCLWIELTMPEKLGFYGFRGAQLNVPLVPSPNARALMAHTTLTPDLLWERERVAIEYQGFDEHVSRASRSEDARRINDYQVCGVIALFVTFDNVRTIARMDKLAKELAARMALHNKLCGEPARIERLLQNDDARAERMRQLARLLPPVNRPGY